MSERDAIDRAVESLRLVPSEVMDKLRDEMHRQDARRTLTEETRSRHRNFNRILVLCCGIVCSFSWPVIVSVITHSPLSAGAMLASFGATVGFTADLAVTFYAWIRRY